MEPQLFAPGFVSTGLRELNLLVVPGGKEIWYTVNITSGRRVFLVTREENGKWVTPRISELTRDYSAVDPWLTSDGKRLFFSSNRPRSGNNEPEDNYDIWYAERTGSGWSEPCNLGQPVNSDADDYYPCLTENGSLYFLSGRDGGSGRLDLWSSGLAGGRYSEPENLGPVFISPGNEGDIGWLTAIRCVVADRILLC